MSSPLPDRAPEYETMGHEHNGRRAPDCAFLDLYGDTVLGRLLSEKVCDLDRDGGHYQVCTHLTNPRTHAWAFAWGLAYALSKPEWAFQVLTEFHPGWQDPNGEGRWPLQIEEAVRRNPSLGDL